MRQLERKDDASERRPHGAAQDGAHAHQRPESNALVGKNIASMPPRAPPIISNGASTPPELEEWRISTKEFREDLQWAIVVAGESDHSPAVVQLLGELRARGIQVESYR